MVIQDLGRRTKTLIIPLLLAACMAAGYLLFQLHFLERFADFDQTVYLNNLHWAIDKDFTIYNAHHLHFEHSGKEFQNFMVRHFGAYGFNNLTFNMRLRSILAASIGIFFACLFFFNLTGRYLWAVLGTVLVGVCHGYLHYAAKIDTGIFPAAAFLVVLWLAERLFTAKKGLFLIFPCGAFILFLGIMMHQYLAIACVALFVCCLLPSFLLRKPTFHQPFEFVQAQASQQRPQLDRQPVVRYVGSIAMCVLALLLVAAAYVYGGLTKQKLSLGDKPTYQISEGPFARFPFPIWLFSYATTDDWGHGLVEFRPEFPIRGYTDSFLSLKISQKYNWFKTFSYDLSEINSPQAFAFNHLAIFTLITLLGTVLLAPALYFRYGRLFLFLLLCAVCYVIFFTYWEPFYFEFWLLPCIILCCLSILLFNYLAELAAKLIKKLTRIIFLPAYAYVFFVCLFLFSHNMWYYVLPYSRVEQKEGTYFFDDRGQSYKYEKLFQKEVYRHPTNVYQDVYGTKPGEIYP